MENSNLILSQFLNTMSGDNLIWERVQKNSTRTWKIPLGLARVIEIWAFDIPFVSLEFKNIGKR